MKQDNTLFQILETICLFAFIWMVLCCMTWSVCIVLGCDYTWRLGTAVFLIYFYVEMLFGKSSKTKEEDKKE